MPTLPALRTWLAALFLALAFPTLVFAQTFPALSGRVVDGANIIPPEIESQLDARLAGLETQSRRQLVVVTLPSLQGYEISDYGYQLGRHWGIGDKQRNDGALLIVAPKERKVRIEVGYGLEPVLTDGLSSLIISQQILPRFKAGDMPGGIVAGADAIVTQLTLPEDEARKIAAEAKPERGQLKDNLVPMIFWLAMMFFFLVLPAIRRARGGQAYRSGSAWPVVVWGGGSGGFGSGGGGFGGGFSGGGGSFGGGGSSGSW